MADGCIEYEETNDLYLQMLWEAQKVDDKRLAKMILRRLTTRRQLSEAREAVSGTVIPFPLKPALCISAEPESTFWKQGQFWQDLLQFFTMLLIAGAWFAFFLHLLVK